MSRMDAVLLDDDSLVHMMWKVAARKSGKNLLALGSVDELRTALSGLSRSVAIYLDSDLGSQGRGEDIGAELAAAGFTELYLVTGYEAERFAHLPWVKGVLGKGAPWAVKPL